MPRSGTKAMSDGNDSRLSRWSRRKLAARADEANETKKEQGETVAEVAADPMFPATVSAVPEAAEPPTTEPVEPLPRLEDLTADSDVIAFLKKGVPMALKSAALRKMWSIDPSIRDYVGPAEYAWDFNQPGSMAGFGPLEAKENIVSFLSKTVRALDLDAEPTAAVTESDDAPLVAEEIIETPETMPPVELSAVRVPVVAAATAAKIAPEVLRATPSALPAQASFSQDPTPLERPRHGGAMPR